MEQAYINDINLKSSFFARLTEERHTVNGLADGVVYVSARRMRRLKRQ